MTLMPRTALRAALLAAALAGTASTLTGCIPLMLGGAAVGASVFTDRRSSGTQLDDQTMAFKAQFQIGKQLGEAARVNAVAYEGNVLLTGDVPTQAAKDQATSIAQGIEKVKSVINQLDVGPAEPFEGRSNDVWLSSKVHTALLSTKNVPSGAIVTGKGASAAQKPISRASERLARSMAILVIGPIGPSTSTFSRMDL